jgi:glycosyltransferase involved in cell wall biosynthesis
VISPRLLVNVGAYNEADYLDETIPAILNQSMPYFALSITDNGSTDATLAILMKYAAHDERIVLTHEEQNLWPPLAANRGISRAFRLFPHTRWCLSHGADDIMEPGYLDAILAAADDDSGANCIFAPRQWIGHPERGVQPWPAYNPATIHAEPQIPAWRAITRELWEQVGEENTSIRIGSDWEWAVRASVAGVLRPVQLEQALLSLRVRPPTRVSQSDEVQWPQLHRHLCAIAGQPVPKWATR